MKYTEVVKLMKQAAVPPMGAANPAAIQARTKAVKTPAPPPKTPDNTFSNGIAAAQKQRQQQINAANRKFTQTTGKAPVLSNAQANQVIDNSIRHTSAQATAQRKADDAKYEEFRQQQRAQNQARAARVNATIAKQEAADRAKRQKATGVAPKQNNANGFLVDKNGVRYNIVNGQMIPVNPPAPTPKPVRVAKPAAPVATPNNTTISTSFSTGPARNIGPGKPVKAPAIKPVTRQPISPPRSTSRQTIRVKR